MLEPDLAFSVDVLRREILKLENIMLQSEPGLVRVQSELMKARERCEDVEKQFREWRVMLDSLRAALTMLGAEPWPSPEEKSNAV